MRRVGFGEEGFRLAKSTEFEAELEAAGFDEGCNQGGVELVAKQDIFDGVHEQAVRQRPLLEHVLGEDEAILVLERDVLLAKPMPENCLQLARLVQHAAKENAVGDASVEDALEADVKLRVKRGGVTTAAVEDLDYGGVLEDIAERAASSTSEDGGAAMDVEDYLERRLRVVGRFHAQLQQGDVGSGSPKLALEVDTECQRGATAQTLVKHCDDGEALGGRRTQRRAERVLLKRRG